MISTLRPGQATAANARAFKRRKFPLSVPVSASSNPCLPCGARPLTQTPAASASTAVQSLFCLEATCGINLSSSTTQQGIHSL